MWVIITHQRALVCEILPFHTLAYMIFSKEPCLINSQILGLFTKYSTKYVVLNIFTKCGTKETTGNI
jgi:hypothetical protein